jgi:hypothetical protein
MDINSPLLEYRMVAPNFIEELAAGKNSLGMGYKKFKQFEFGVTNLDLIIVNTDTATHWIDC